MNAQWFKVNFNTRNGMVHNAETALVLATDELQALDFIREMAGQHFVSSDAVPYCTTPVMSADFNTRNHGEQSNVDYIVVALK